MNMKRYFLLLFVMLSTLSIYAQSGMTDTQVMEFIVKEHNKGTSQTQIVTKLMQNGVDISQIRRVRDTYEKMKKGKTTKTRKMKPTNIQTSDWILNLITQTHTMKKTEISF